MNKHNNLKKVWLVVMIWLAFVTTTGICSADFSYSIRNPKDSSATRYVVSKTNISSRTEGDFIYLCPSSGGATLETSSPGVIVYHFSFEETITEATLSIRTSTFHWAYSRGHSFVYAATDGYNWIKLTEAPPPDYGGWNAGNFSGSLPQAFVGKKDIYVKVELYSYGESASKGGIYCNTAQHLRYDSNQDNVTFNIEVKTSTLPITETLPLPTDKICFPNYSPVVLAEAGINPPVCKPIGVGNIAGEGDTVSIEIKLDNPSGPYDAYLALNAPAIDPDEFFMLGQDGTFYPLSQSGLVKWKQSATGKIDEKPFGDFPASLLPGGTYNFYFLLTPAESLDAYYLWQTSFSVPETQINVPDGSAGYFNGTLVVPNATIIYQGQLHDGSAPLADDGLAAIRKDGQIYFYHPALGQAELSEYNSRRAVGYFVARVSASEVQALRTQRARAVGPTETSLRSASTTVTKVLTQIGEKVELETGVDIELLDDTGRVKATNTRRRWAVVKTGPTNKDKYFLVPRANSLPTELLDQFEFLGRIYIGDLDGAISDIDIVRSDIVASDKIETFGAFNNNTNYLSNSQREAFEEDFDLTCLLNTIDHLYTDMELYRNLFGLIPLECSDVFFNTLFRYYQSDIVRDKGVDLEARWEVDAAFVKSILSSFTICAGELITLPAAPASVMIEIYSSVSDIFSLFQYVIEDVVLDKLWSEDHDAYDLATFEMTDMMAYLQKDASGTKTEIVHNLEDYTIWTVPVIAIPDEAEHRIVAMTPNGVVLSLTNNAHPDKFFTTTDWGRGQQTDILDVLGATNSPFDYQGSECLDITDSGRLFFKYGKLIKTHPTWVENQDGIYTIMADGSNGHFVPIVIDQEEFDWNGFDNIRVNALAVSGDGTKLVFSASDFTFYNDHEERLFAVDTSGENLHELALSYSDIEQIDINYSGNMIMFDYTTPEGKTSLCTVSVNGGAVIDLAKASNLKLDNSSAVISPDGNWVAAVAGGVQDNTYGIAFIRTDGSDYHWIDTVTRGVGPHATLPLSFTLDGKAVVFSGYESGNFGNFDIFAVDNDRERPNLRNLTNTPALSETWPLLR